MLIRDAVPGDAPSIGLVHVRSWQATYRGVVPDAVLDALDASERGRVWAHRLPQLGPGARVLVVEVAEGVVGFVAVGGTGEVGVGEVFSLYLDPDVIGTGVGRALFAAAVDALRDLGFRRAVLWVGEANMRARRFYEAAGWRADGECKVDGAFGAPIAEVRYCCELAPTTVLV